MRGRRGEGVLGGVGVVVGAVRAGPIALSTSLSQGRAIGTGALTEDTVIKDTGTSDSDSHPVSEDAVVGSVGKAVPSKGVT